jgi:hypothetical protein
MRVVPMIGDSIGGYPLFVPAERPSLFPRFDLLQASKGGSRSAAHLRAVHEASEAMIPETEGSLRLMMTRAFRAAAFCERLQLNWSKPPSVSKGIDGLSADSPTVPAGGGPFPDPAFGWSRAPPALS